MRVFCNGFNSYGQLNTKRTVLANFEPLFQFEVIRKVCINHFFSVILTSNGCWVCEKNELKLIPMKHVEKIRHITCNDEKIILLSETGKLTKSDLDNLFDFKEIPLEVSTVSTYGEEKIINVSSCSKLTVAYSNKSTIFEIPNKLHFSDPSLIIIDVKCGREHCVLLDQSGAVYSFGRGSRGQLGHGMLDDEQEPVLVKALAGIKITQISAGGWHSCALSQDGDLYVWGWNGNGQLGLSTDRNEACISVMTNPTVVDVDGEDSQRNVLMMASGCRHTIALLDNNQLYGCGWNKYKQLKDVEEENIYQFTHLHDFREENVVDVICGPWNCAVICD